MRRSQIKPGRRKKAKKATHPDRDFIDACVDPDFDDMQEAEQRVREQYGGRPTDND